MRKLTTDESSNVRSITFEPPPPGADAGSLVVEFAGGRTYRYAGCTLDDFASACHAPSVGAWVRVALVQQPTKHPYARVEQSPAAEADRAARHATALQQIASLPDNFNLWPLVKCARDALEGRTPPTPPERLGKPRVCDASIDEPGRLVTWPDPITGVGNWLPPMTPDEAEAVAHALLAAALEARL